MKNNITCLVLGAFFITHAQAEDVRESTMETITVIGKSAVANATIAGTAVKDLPINVHVLNQEEVMRLKFVAPDELLDRIPGETQVRNLRIPDGGKGYTVPLLDGIPLENPYEGATQRLDRVNTQDIQRVEIIKGPASAVYANNAFGGVINIVSRDAPTEAETSVWAEAGTFGRQRAGVFTGGTYKSLAYFLDANIRRLDGAREQGKNNRNQVSAKLQYALSETASLTSRVEYFAQDLVARGDLNAEQIADNPRQAGRLSSSTDLKQKTVSLRVNKDFSLSSLEGFLVLREKDTKGVSRFRGPEAEIDKSVSSKLIYHHNFTALRAVVGFETYNGEQKTKRFAREDVNLQGKFRRFTDSLDILAGFVQYEYTPVKWARLTAGARYEDIEITSGRHGLSSAKFNDISPKLGAVFQVSNNNAVWLGLSQGFYAPDAGDLFDIETGNSDLRPEESNNIEIGLRGQAGAWNFDSSFYHNTIDNYLVTQEYEQNGFEFERVTNAGKVRVQGIETVLEFAPQSVNWRVGLTHTYARNRYIRFVSSDGDFSGNDLGRSPSHHFNVRLAWSPIESLTAEIEGDFYSPYYSDIANTPAGRFTRDERVNVRVDYKMGAWKFWLHGINLSNTIEDRATFRRGALRFRTVDGRSYYAGVEYDF